MASVKICDGRTVVYQYDTGVSIELCDCRDFTECHFAVNDGIIRRVVEGNICSVPDAALVNAGTLTVYAFSRNDDGGQTQHTFFIHVMARPKPADYIDPPGEADYLDQLYDRLKDEIVGPPGKDGVGISSLEQVRYTTADGGVNTWKATLTDGTYSLFNVTNGSKGSPGEPGAPGAPGSSGVYIGKEAPTDANVWIDPEGTGTETLPNPHPLVINGVSYDGSERVEIKEPEFELIDTIVCDGTVSIVSKTGLTLTHAKVRIHTQAAAAVASIAVEARNDASMFGYAWIGNAINTGERWSYAYLVSDGKNAYCQYVGPATSTYGATAINKTVNEQDASTPINKITVYATGNALFPKDTVITIEGVRA